MGSGIDELGLLLDLEALKARIRRCCAELDERTLVPTRCSLLSVGEDGDEVSVDFEGRHYRLPSQDVVALPLRNISIEELALHLWRELAVDIDRRAVELEVEVAETAGQSCRYRAPLPEAAA